MNVRLNSMISNHQRYLPFEVDLYESRKLVQLHCPAQNLEPVSKKLDRFAWTQQLAAAPEILSAVEVGGIQIDYLSISSSSASSSPDLDGPLFVPDAERA
jgi:hypothetical protein